MEERGILRGVVGDGRVVILGRKSGGEKKVGFLGIFLRVMYTFIGIGVVIGIIIAMRVYVVDQFAIPTDSMRPTLIPGDYVIVNKLIAGARIYDRLDFKDGDPLECHRMKGLRKVEHNDIVIFNFPINRSKYRIEFKINYVYGKRCIGLPGDTVEIRNGYFKNNNYNGIFGVEEEQRRLSETPDSLSLIRLYMRFRLISGITVGQSRSSDLSTCLGRGDR